MAEFIAAEHERLMPIKNAAEDLANLRNGQSSLDFVELAFVLCNNVKEPAVDAGALGEW